MTMRGRGWRRVLTALILAYAAVLAPRAMAQDADTVREAAKRFQRGVALYGEADYRGALVEFKRACTLMPTAACLYNIGETEYQLQDYAAALVIFERYLAEASPTDSHRTEVEGNVEVLRARVGHVTITTVPPGADITIDDQAVGKTPLDKSVLVSIGHRKVVASLAGRLPVTRYIDVAAEDNLSVTLQLPSGGLAQTAGPFAQQASAGEASSSRGSGARFAGWVATGVLAAGAATFGLFALKESNDLGTGKDTLGTPKDTLNHRARLTLTYSILADTLAIGAVVVGGITLYSTLSSSKSPAVGAGSVKVSLGLASARFETTF
jgi:tetratricopeptide (TPR) repeat protein